MWLFSQRDAEVEQGPGAEQLGPAPMDENQGGALEAHGLPKLPRAVRTKVTSSEQSAVGGGMRVVMFADVAGAWRPVRSSLAAHSCIWSSVEMGDRQRRLVCSYGIAA
jgi:hypothetical protein